MKEKYNIDNDVLGCGGFSKVFRGRSKEDREFMVAIKVISKSHFHGNTSIIHNEINILKQLDHPRVIKYYETFENAKYIYIVMEYCKSKDLFTYITQKSKEKGVFTEAEVSFIIE